MVTVLVVKDSRSVCAMALASRKSRMDFILCKSEPGVSGGCVADPVARAKGRPKRLRYVHRSREGCNRQVVSTNSIFGPRAVCCQLICGLGSACAAESINPSWQLKPKLVRAPFRHGSRAASHPSRVPDRVHGPLTAQGRRRTPPQ